MLTRRCMLPVVPNHRVQMVLNIMIEVWAERQYWMMLSYGRYCVLGGC